MTREMRSEWDLLDGSKTTRSEFSGNQSLELNLTSHLVYITNSTPAAFPHALSQSMHYYTSPIASRPWVPYGAIGPSRWSAIVAHFSQQFAAGVIHMRHSIDMWSKRHSLRKSELFTMFLRSFAFALHIAALLPVLIKNETYVCDSGTHFNQ